MKIIVAAAEFCRRDKSHEFVRLIAATKLAKAAFLHRVYTSGNKSLRQNINEPMRERHMVNHIELENYFTFLFIRDHCVCTERASCHSDLFWK